MVSWFRAYRKKLGSVLALACLFGSVTLAQNVQRKYLPGIDFSKYKTYKWVESKHQYPDPTVDAQIKQSFDTQFAAKGLKKTDGTADLTLDYQTATTQQETWVVYEDWAAGAGAGWGANRLPQRKQVTIDVGTLVLDIYDTAAKKLVWSGSASKTLEPESSSKDRQENVDKAAKKLLPKFPPK
jgi:Domain of unknown function (DUF4136)